MFYYETIVSKVIRRTLITLAYTQFTGFEEAWEFSSLVIGNTVGNFIELDQKAMLNID